MDNNRQDETSNYETFRECVSKSILNRSIEKKSNHKARGKRKAKPGQNAAKSQSSSSLSEENDPEELAEFIDVCNALAILFRSVLKLISLLVPSLGDI